MEMIKMKAKNKPKQTRQPKRDDSYNKAVVLAGVLKSADPTLTIREGNQDALAEHAEAIRELGKRTLANLLEIGRRLCESKKLTPHGKWGTWLDEQFGWTADTARNFMRAYEFSQDCKNRNFRHLKIAPSALYLLTQRNTPARVVDEIVKRAEKGETINIETIKTALTQPTQSQGQSQDPDWRVRQVRGWYTAGKKHAVESLKYGHPAADYLVPALLLQAMDNSLDKLDELEAAFRKGGEALITAADQVKRMRALLPPAPMFNDTPTAPSEAASSEAASSDAASD
jgi:Protein of unknown function (DUF3102)